MEEIYGRVIAVLDRLGVQWTVVGAHAVNAYSRPRATVDIDLVVEGRKLKSILEALRGEFDQLELDDMGAAVRLLDLSVDLIRSDNHPLFRAALDDAVDMGTVRVPPPELLIALKFLAATSPWRKKTDRGQDAVDLLRVYESAGPELDRNAMLRYAATIYPGAEKELAQLLERADRGEKVFI